MMSFNAEATSADFLAYRHLLYVCSNCGSVPAEDRVAIKIHAKTAASDETKTMLTVRSDTGGFQPRTCASSYAATAMAKSVTDQIQTRIRRGKSPARYETIRWMKSESRVSVHTIPAQNIEPTTSAPATPASAANATA